MWDVLILIFYESEDQGSVVLTNPHLKIHYAVNKLV